jgi:hypothetical protein
MFGNADLIYELNRLKKRSRKGEDSLVSEAKKILKQDLFTETKILQHLQLYKGSFHMLDEEDLDSNLVYTLAEIRQLAVIYRLKFLPSELYKAELPYEVEFKLSYLNQTFQKELKAFNILAAPPDFSAKTSGKQAMAFVKTNYENYYLLHSWGQPLKQSRKWLFLPLRRFETLVVSVILFTLLLDLALPTRLITLDHSANYWSGYRAAAFFHLLIFNFGVTAYLTFAFAKNFSSSVWNRYTDF